MSFDGPATPSIGGADIDHRKKRRNRTTHSCINCHTTKRKCDRKRPCGRCTQLGLTGLCVYEVADPNADDPNLDETSKLRNRVAELEGVIRELKNKPHPKWASQPSGGDLSFHTRSQLAKKRRLSDDDDDDEFGYDTAGPSNSLVKMEPHGSGFGTTAYTLPDSFRLPSESSYDSPRPVPCECLTSSATIQSLTDLEGYMRSTVGLLSSLRHAPLTDGGPTSPTSPHERCSLLSELTRLQHLIAQSTRTMPGLPGLPTIRQPSPPLSHGHGHGHGRGSLSVQVPLNFSDSISHGVSPSFSLRPPPPSASTPGGAYHNHHHGAFSSSACCDSGPLMSPPLNTAGPSGSGASPWDSMPASATTSSSSPLLQSMHVPRQTVSSPALSHASSRSNGSYSHGSQSSSGGPLPSLSIPVPECLERDAVTSLVGMYNNQHTSQPAPFFPGHGPATTSSVPFDYELGPPPSNQSGFPDFGLSFQMRAAAY